MDIESNTFSEACFDTNSIHELESAIAGDADESDMRNWGISDDEWRDQIKLAISALRSE